MKPALTVLLFFPPQLSRVTFFAFPQNLFFAQIDDANTNKPSLIMLHVALYGIRFLTDRSLTDQTAAEAH